MCGIFGWCFKRDNMPPRETRVKLATVLGLLNDNRGGKSWGWGSQPQGTESSYVIARGLNNIVGQASDIASRSIVMAHTRMPTNGSVKVENAHPFEIGKVIGAHNGMIYNWQSLETKYPERKPFAVDSMHIFAHIDEGKDMKELEGYGAIEFMLKGDDKQAIYLCRISSGGDLDVVRTEHGIIWSSSGDHLNHALEAAGLASKASYKMTTGEVAFAEGGKLYESDAKMGISSGYKVTGGGNYHTSGDWGNWGVTNSGGTNVKSDDKCRSDFCGAPLDAKGVCTLQYDEGCSQGTSTTASTTRYCSVFDCLDPALSGGTHMLCKDHTELLNCPDYNLRRTLDDSCEPCKTNTPMYGAMHRVVVGSNTSYTLCKGPGVYLVALAVAAMELLPDSKTIDIGENEHKVKCVLVDGKPWYTTDAHDARRKAEAADTEVTAPY